MASTKIHWKFTPTSPALSWRYLRSSSVKVAHRTLTPALFSQMDSPHPAYLPPQWSVCTNPEGNQYFIRSSSPRIVTEMNLFEPDMMRCITDVVQALEQRLEKFSSAISEATEAFIELEDEETCSYYLVDHTLRVPFWLEEVQTEAVALRESVSNNHLRFDLEKLYWMHVEYFPAHDAVNLKLSIDELIDIMVHGRTDQMTSVTSTFPYDADECTRFIHTLELAQGSKLPPSAHTKWTVARIWRNIADQRFITHYGQEHARLSSNISILEKSPPAKTVLFKFVSAISFGAPSTYLRLLNDQWVDEWAHAQRWRPFMSACHEDWKMSLLISFAILMCNLLLVSSPLASSTPVAVAALLLCNAAIGFSILLFIQHGPTGCRKEASDIAWYLQNVDTQYFGLQLPAILFSLPRVFTLWALIVSSLQVLVVSLGLVLAAICIGGAVGGVLLCALCVKLVRAISAWSASSHWQVFRRYLARTPSEKSMV